MGNALFRSQKVWLVPDSRSKCGRVNIHDTIIFVSFPVFSFSLFSRYFCISFIIFSFFWFSYLRLEWTYSRNVFFFLRWPTTTNNRAPILCLFSTIVRKKTSIWYVRKNRISRIVLAITHKRTWRNWHRSAWTSSKVTPILISFFFVLFILFIYILFFLFVNSLNSCESIVLVCFFFLFFDRLRYLN